MVPMCLRTKEERTGLSEDPGCRNKAEERPRGGPNSRLHPLCQERLHPFERFLITVKYQAYASVTKTQSLSQ